MPRSTNAAVVSVLLGAVLFGTAGTAQALGPAGTTPIGVGTVRLLVGGLGLLLVLPLLGHRRVEALRAARSPWVIASVIGTASYQLCFFAGVERAGVALGTLVAVGSAPLFAGLLGWATGHPPTRAWGVATAVCLLGLTLLSAQGLTGGEPAGVALALGAGLAVAAYTVAVKRAFDAGGRPGPVLTASFLLGGLVLLPVLATQPLAWLAAPCGVALAVYLGLATMTVANVLHARGLARLAPGPVATLMLVEPLVATVLGAVVLGERLTAPAGAGLLLVLGGLLLLGASVRRSDPEPVVPL